MTDSIASEHWQTIWEQFVSASTHARYHLEMLAWHNTMATAFWVAAFVDAAVGLICILVFFRSLPRRMIGPLVCCFMLLFALAGNSTARTGDMHTGLHQRWSHLAGRYDGLRELRFNRGGVTDDELLGRITELESLRAAIMFDAPPANYDLAYFARCRLKELEVQLEKLNIPDAEPKDEPCKPSHANP